MDTTLWGVFSTVLVLSAGQRFDYPVSPCPDVFQYLADSKGYIRIWPPRSGLPLYLRVQMFLPAALPSEYPGRIVLAEDKDLVFQRLQAGIKERIKYHVLFPLRNPLPRIDKIIVNDNIVCQGPQIHAPLLTKISLDHNLFPVANSLNGLDNFGPVEPSTSFEPEGGNFNKPEVFYIPDEYYGSFEDTRPSNNKKPWERPNYNQPSSGSQFGGSNQRPSGTQFEVFDLNERPFNGQSGTQFGSNQRPSSGQTGSQFGSNQRPSSGQTGSQFSSNQRPSSGQTGTQFGSNQLPFNSQTGSQFGSNQRPSNGQTGTQFGSIQRPSASQTDRPSRPQFEVFPSDERPFPGQSGRPPGPEFEMFGSIERPFNGQPERPSGTQVGVPGSNQRPATGSQPSGATSSQRPSSTQLIGSSSNQRPSIDTDREPPFTNPWTRPGQVPREPVNTSPQETTVITPNMASKDVCGRSVQPNELVVNGRRTKRGEWPWIAAMFTTTNRGQDFLCSATLFTKRHVLTAGHCIKPRDRPQLNPNVLVVYLGKFRLRRFAEPFVQPREVEQAFVHPDYGTSTSFDADLAVLLLHEPVVFSHFVIPVCLWDRSTSLSPVVGKLGTVVGWGRDELGNKGTDEPRISEMPIVSQEECLHSRMDFISITSNRTFCAGFRNNTGPCNGDSGSGFVMPFTENSNPRPRWYLRGLVSVSLYDSEKNTCDLLNYVVFTDLAKHLSWLATFTD